MNKLPVIYLTIDEDHETGLDAISLVDHPAIERNWMAFNKKQKFSLNEEKRIVSGCRNGCRLPNLPKEMRTGASITLYSTLMLFVR
jgi:hypothetical protein